MDRSPHLRRYETKRQLIPFITVSAIIDNNIIIIPGILS